MDKKKAGVLIPVAKRGKTEPEKYVTHIVVKEGKVLKGRINSAKAVGRCFYFSLISGDDVIAVSKSFDNHQECKLEAYKLADQLYVPVRFWRNLKAKKVVHE